MMKSDTVVRALAALAQASRLAIFRALVRRGPDGYTPGELQGKLGIAPATLSFHLKALQHAGLITMQREGRFLYYSADFELMKALLAYLGENCCSLADTACGTDCVPVKAGVRKRS